MPIKSAIVTAANRLGTLALWSAFALLSARGVAASADGVATGTIEGSVVSATNGQLLPHARVFLHRSAAQKEDYATWIETDDNGRFVFKGIEQGTYELVGQKSGFFTDPRKALLGSFDVAAGASVKGLVIRLMPLSVVTGIIVNEHQDPVQNVQVKLMAREFYRGHLSLTAVGFATTDDRGEYRIFGVHPGIYYVVTEYDPRKAIVNPFPGIAVRDTPPEKSYAPMFYPATSDLRQAQRIPVASGAEIRLNFALMSVTSVSMEGTVVNGMTGEPISKPAIVAYWGDRISGITRQVDATKPGIFRVDGIEPGPYTLIASASEGGETYSDFRVVEVGSGGLKDVQLALMPDFSVAGSVRMENPGRDAPQHISVEFMPLDKNNGPFRVNAERPKIPVRTIDPSLFSFSTKLHPGDHYKISLTNLPQDYYLKSVLIDGHDMPSSDVVIYGKTPEMLLVASPAGGHVEGLVRDAREQGVAAHVLVAVDTDRLTPEMMRTVNSDAQGKFLLRGLSPGSYKLYAFEELDLNELSAQPELLKNFEGSYQLLRVDEDGHYWPELRIIPAR